jgi:hypothetical protein
MGLVGSCARPAAHRPGYSLYLWALCRSVPSGFEQVRGARARRYCFYFDEVAEAEAQGLPYVLAPRVLSREEWEKEYCPKEPEASP